MTQTFSLRLLTPRKSLFEGAVESVELPGEQGSFGVLAGHAKFVSALQPGVMIVRLEGRTERYVLAGGFAEVHAAGVTVLADASERPEEIDTERAEQSRQRALQGLRELDPTDEAGRNRLEVRLARAEVRLRVAAGR